MTVAIPLLLGFVFGASLFVAVLAWRGIELPSRSGRWRGRVDKLGSLRLLVAVVAGLVMWALTGWVVAGIAALAGVLVLPHVAGGGRRRAAALARTEALASWAEQLRDTLAGAAGLEETITATVRVGPTPIRPELARLAARLERDPLGPSLRVFADELSDPLGDLIVSTLVLAGDQQVKDLGALLGALADAARAHASMQLRVEAGRAGIRTAVRIITAVTLAFAGGLVVFNRAYLEPFDTGPGQVALVVVVGCFAAGFWLLARMAQPRPLPRVLIRTGAPA